MTGRIIGRTAKFSAAHRAYPELIRASEWTLHQAFHAERGFWPTHSFWTREPARVIELESGEPLRTPETWTFNVERLVDHDCDLPDLVAFRVEADRSDDWRAEFWQCRKCRQTWTVDEGDHCRECHRQLRGPVWAKCADLLVGPEPDPANLPPTRVMDLFPVVQATRGGIDYNQYAFRRESPSSAQDRPDDR